MSFQSKLKPLKYILYIKYRENRLSGRKEKVKKNIIIVMLAAALLVGVLSGCVEEEPTTDEKPVAMFTIDPTTGIYINTTITFTDASTDDGTIQSWAWDFGDETTSTEQNPTHAYDAVDTYTVSLTVTDDGGQTSDPYTMDIEVTNVPPSVEFTYAPEINITVNETITFTSDVTIGDANISTYLWDFGDDTNSTLENPEHNYTAAGTYTVTLTVTDENAMTGTATETITVEEETES